MSGPKKFVRTETVEAMQWTGENFAELRAWLNAYSPIGNPSRASKDQVHVFGVGLAPIGHWFVKGSDHPLEIIHPDELARLYRKTAEPVSTEPKQPHSCPSCPNYGDDDD